MTQDPKKTLGVGVPSAMTIVSADVGVHDLTVGPGESIHAEDGVEAQFIHARGTP